MTAAGVRPSGARLAPWLCCGHLRCSIRRLMDPRFIQGDGTGSAVVTAERVTCPPPRSYGCCVADLTGYTAGATGYTASLPTAARQTRRWPDSETGISVRFRCIAAGCHFQAWAGA